MLKRILCALLASMMLIPLASCANDSEENETKSPSGDTPNAENTDTEEEETSKYLDDLPETMDFGGIDIRFTVEEGNNGDLSERSIYVEEDTADIVDSAIYRRNAIVSDRLKVNIVLQDVLSFNSLITPLRTAVTSNVDDYDVVGFYQYYGIGTAAEGLLYNLNNLQYNDFSREYWASGYIDNMSYRGNVFWATGDLSLRYTGGLYVTYVNDRISKEYYPDLDVYAMVDEGAWTLDKMYELSSGVYQDFNADGLVNEGDIGGLSLLCNDLIDGTAAGSMIEFGYVDETGMPIITLSENEKTYSFYEKMFKMLYNNPGYIASTDDDSTTLMNNFNNGKYMMTINKLYQSEIYLREMEDDFKIIPVPKYDENQEHYNTRVHDSVTIFGTPITAYGKFDAISATLEAMASESHRLVTPNYYEVALKAKYVRDSDSGRMIDLIHENVSCDFITLYSEPISNVNHFFRNQLANETESIASQFKLNNKLWKKSAEILVEDFEKVLEDQAQ